MWSLRKKAKNEAGGKEDGAPEDIMRARDRVSSKVRTISFARAQVFFLLTPDCVGFLETEESCHVHQLLLPALYLIFVPVWVSTGPCPSRCILNGVKWKLVESKKECVSYLL